MANYVLVFKGGGMAETEAEQQAVMAAWGEWYGKLGQAVVDGGNRSDRPSRWRPTARSATAPLRA